MTFGFEQPPGRPAILGKFPGVVTRLADAGKLYVKVPLLWGDQELPAPALPCWPAPAEHDDDREYTTAVKRVRYLVPPAGAGVWVEFMGGDPDHPIWVGLYEAVQ